MDATKLHGPVAVEDAVRNRYRQAAQLPETQLCCAVQYPRKYLEVIPQEILDVDYGCGDPTRYVEPNQTVLDLGSGSGKMCYILAQVVGPQGRVIGVDCNEQMLQLARRYQHTVAERLGYANVEFRCGLIQDLQLDLERLNQRLAGQAIQSVDDWLNLRQLEATLRHETPLIANESIDCVVSNCVLNLVRPEDRRQLFSEVFRVLRPGGRAVISDIVADETVPPHLMQDSHLWSGCISGAFVEEQFLEAFADAGFHGIEITAWQNTPWRVVEGIEFRSITVSAYKGKQGPCLERRQALIYRGPFSKVEDDDGHVFRRGQRIAVCDKTYRLLQQPPYSGMFEPIEPREIVPLEEASSFDCRRAKCRHPRETKGEGFDLTTTPSECCGSEGCC